jgi:hypothetical protein
MVVQPILYLVLGTGDLVAAGHIFLVFLQQQEREIHQAQAPHKEPTEGQLLHLLVVVLAAAVQRRQERRVQQEQVGTEQLHQLRVHL